MIDRLLKFEFGVKGFRLNFHILLLLVGWFLPWLSGGDGMDDCIFRFAPVSHKVFVNFFYEHSMGSVFSLVDHYCGSYK